MGHSERLRLGDVRAVFHLLGEVRELGDDPTAWQRHLSGRLAGMFGARLVLTGESILARVRGPVLPVVMAEFGWVDEKERGFFLGHVVTLDWDTFPHMPPYFLRLAAQGAVCRRRRELTDDGPWYRWHHALEIRAGTDQDDLLLATRWLPGIDGQYNISLFRAWGDRPFRVSQRRLLSLLIMELTQLWEPDPGRTDPFAEMPARCRQTLERLLAGDSEKQVAARLGVSAHTVHVYVKALHRHFGVSSRGELLARCHQLTRADHFRPRLVLASRPDPGSGN
jgi:DNA-binding CsgD family transcriptional regulator